MKFRVALSSDRRSLTVRGVPAVILLLGILVLPYLLAGSLEPEEAERRIREYLLREVTRQQMAELESGGTRVPDRETALRWEEQINRVNELEFDAVEVKRAVLVPPLRRRTNFVAKAVFRDENRRVQTRYFWFNGTSSSSVGESSEPEWYLPI